MTEQHRRDHAVLEADDIRIVRQLPQAGADAHADEPVGDDRRLPDWVVIIKRQAEDHARLLGSRPARLSRGLTMITAGPILIREKHRGSGTDEAELRAGRLGKALLRNAPGEARQTPTVD